MSQDRSKPNSSAPRISVIVPCYNSTGTIRRAIDSVRAQSLRPHELIIVDDGSTDSTAEYAESLGGDLTVLRQPANLGPSAARNRGAEMATGDVLAFLDADDVWYPDKLAAQIIVLENDHTVAIASTEFVRFSTSAAVPEQPTVGNPRWTKESFRDILRNPYLGTPTVAIRTSIFRELGGFDTELRFGEDVDLWLRVATRYPIARIHNVLCAVASSANSLTSSGGESADLGNLVVLAKLSERHPESVSRHRRDYNRAVAEVYTRIASGRLTRGSRADGRRALREALRTDWAFPRAWYLLARSFVPL